MIDWVRVRDLRAEIGEADFAEVVAMFLDESDEVIARLCGDHAPASPEQDLHFLKGAALNLGFSHLAALCQDGERLVATRGGPVPMDPVRVAYETSRQTLLDGLKTRVA